MSKTRRHILPFFIPHLGCPNQCIFCDQKKIAGCVQPPTGDDLTAVLQNLPPGAEDKPELAFYGGSFTAIPTRQQLEYLQPAAKALQEGRISDIRLSTRPDAIDEPRLSLLRQFGVDTVELGVQSMTDGVLKAARRGHTAEDSLRAVRLLKKWGFVAGVQLMPGLPGETAASALLGAERILAEKPAMLRIYPTVVLKGTECEALYQSGSYQPLSLAEAVEISLQIKLLAEDLRVQVIRIGLQPTEELAAQVLAGPYHESFGALVQAFYWRQKLLFALRKLPLATECYLNRRDIAAAVGYQRQNLAYYPPRLRLRGREMAAGSLLLKAADGQEFCLSDTEFAAVYLARCRKNWR
ncbi:MAG: radical SAM protein [Firmicutes bacterium]|nr:radical SAM protein [Bacillota bacterium]